MIVRTRSSDMERRTRVFAVTWLCYAAFYLTRKNFSVAKAVLIEKPTARWWWQSHNDDHAATPAFTAATLGQVDAAFLAAYAVAQFWLGPVADAVGVRTMLALMLLGSALASAGFSLCGSSAALMALAWAVNGACQSAGYPTCVMALTPLFAARERGAAMGWWCTCQQVGGVAATALAAYLVGGGGSWRTAFTVPAVAVAACAVLAYFALDGPAPARPPRPPPVRAPTARPGGPPLTPRSLARAKRARSRKDCSLISRKQIPSKH